MFLKNKNIIFKIRRSKVTDYAALIYTIYHTDLTVLNFMGTSIGTKRVKCVLIVSWLAVYVLHLLLTVS